MTVKEAMASPSLLLIVYALLIGIAWGELRMTVGQKADRAEVLATADALKTRTDSGDAALKSVVMGIAADVQIIKKVLCAQAARDSFCHAPIP